MSQYFAKTSEMHVWHILLWRHILHHIRHLLALIYVRKAIRLLLSPLFAWASSYKMDIYIYSLYSIMYDETSDQSLEFSFWCDLFKVSCFLSETCSMYICSRIRLNSGVSFITFCVHVYKMLLTFHSYTQDWLSGEKFKFLSIFKNTPVW